MIKNLDTNNYFLPFLFSYIAHFVRLNGENSLKYSLATLEFIEKLKFNFSDETFENFVAQKAFNKD